MSAVPLSVRRLSRKSISFAPKTEEECEKEELADDRADDAAIGGRERVRRISHSISKSLTYKAETKVVAEDDIERTPVLRQAGTVTYGSALRPSLKDEDRISTMCLGDSGPCAFAVFDGHSGKGAAEACAAKERGLCARILADPTSDPTDPVSIEQAFWDADAEIGTAGERSGTTATVLVCAPHASGVRCTLAWVGDSSAVHFDVSPNKTCRLEGRIHHTTVDHSPKMSKEVAFLNHLCDLRDAIDVGAASVDAAARQVRAREPTADDLRVFGRAIDRKWLIAKTLDPAGKSARRRAIVMKRAGKNSKGKASKTTVVATAEDSSDPHYYDLAMTRSIGDWPGPEMVLPHPEFLTFDVPHGERARVILGTDGYWRSVESPHDATMRARVAPTAQEAADLLLADRDATLEERKRERGGVQGKVDDAAIVVIDLNPSLLPFEPPSLAYLLECPVSSIVCKVGMLALCGLMAATALIVVGFYSRHGAELIHEVQFIFTHGGIQEETIVRETYKGKGGHIPPKALPLVGWDHAFVWWGIVLAVLCIWRYCVDWCSGRGRE